MAASHLVKAVGARNRKLSSISAMTIRRLIDRPRRRLRAGARAAA
jgi:hypothetical protein